MPKPIPTADEVRALLHYNPETGIFTRAITTGGRYGGKAGSVPGTVNDQGYLLISVKSKQYRAHRLAVLWMTGSWPAAEIDHINGQRLDNRWVNLRDVPTVVNAQNRRSAQQNSKTGLLGASWSKREKKFVSRIMVSGRYLMLGKFDTAIDAHLTYVEAKRQFHAGCSI